MNQHYIDKRFREKLEGLEVNPPVEAWLSISDAIDQSSRKGVVPVFLRMAATVAVLIVSLFSLNFLLLNRAGQESEIAGWSAPGAPLIDLPPSEGSISDQAFDSPVLGEAPVFLTRQVVRPLISRELIPEPAMLTANNDRYANRPVLFPRSFSGEAEPGADSGSPDERPFESAMDQVVLAAATDGSGGYSNISFGAYFAPQYNYRILRGTGDMSFNDIPFQSLEEQIMTYSVGLNAFFELSPRWTLQTGISYMNMGQYVRDITSYQHPSRLPLFNDNPNTGKVNHPQSIITSQGNIRLDDPFLYFADSRSYRVLTNRHALGSTDVHSLNEAREGITQVFRFVEIPVVFRYALLQGNVGVRLKGGLAASYLLNNDVFLGDDIMQNPIGETAGIRLFNFSAVGGFAMDIPLTGNLTFHLEPTGQIFISPIVNEGIMTGHAHPYGFSLQTGISYGF